MMSSSKFTEQLEACVREILTSIRKASRKVADMRSTDNRFLQSENNSLEQNGNDALANIFSSTIEENDILEDMVLQIQDAVRQLRENPSYVDENYNYLLDVLYYFNFKGDSFDETPSADLLPSFEQAMKIFIQSLIACQAAHRGQLKPIEKFLTDDPSSKNRPLYYGETLLYIAAKENHIELIKYLVEKVGCSVNAATLAEKPTLKNVPLHIAFIRNHNEVVRYLLDHGADCYQLNMDGKNPLTVSSLTTSTAAIVREYLALDYVQNNPGNIDLPSARVLDHLAENDYDYRKFKINCVWESLKVDEKRWELLEANECAALNKKFREKSNPNEEIHIDGPDRISISTIDFKRKANGNATWIRCRGSSVYNFDVISKWQAMWIVHPAGIDCSKSPLTEIRPIVIGFNIRMNEFQHKLFTWYNLNYHLNATIDRAMDQRLRYLIINESPFGEIKFDLQSFSFSDEKQTIEGYIRWLPEFVIVDDATKRIIPMNLFQKIDSNTKQLRLFDHKMQRNFSSVDEPVEFVEDSDEIPNDKNSQTMNDMADLDSKELDTELDNELISESSPISADLLSLGKQQQLKKTAMDQNAAVKRLIQKNLTEKMSDLTKLEQEVKKEKEKVILISKLTSKTEETPELQNLSKQCIEQKKKIEEIAAQLKASEEREKQLKKEILELENQIKPLESNIKSHERDIQDLAGVNYVIPGTIEVKLPGIDVENYLKSIDYDQKTTKNTNLISISSQELQFKVNYQKWIVKGYARHHEEIKEIIGRTNNLIGIVQEQKKLYRQELNQESNELQKKLKGIKFQCDGKSWKTFCGLFQTFLKERRNTMIIRFSKDLATKTTQIIGAMIKNESNWSESLPNHRILFTSSNLLKKSMKESVKQVLKTYSDKMNEVLSSKQLTKASIDAKSVLLQRIHERFDSEKIDEDNELRYFTLLSSFINRIDLIMRCCELQLPLFESAVELLDKIQSSPITAISTGTGSGKSTLLPILLAAVGYDKILITQPRRLPCNLLSTRVNSSMSTFKLSGWTVAGAKSKHVRNAPIVYLTDGLLKDYLLYREQYLIHQARANRNGLIIMIDEVHERSISIDLCLGLLARLLKDNQSISSKLKVIVSSATLQPSILKIFGSLKVAKFEKEPRKLHQVKINSNCNKNLIELICELNDTLDANDQILCFLKSTVDVRQSIKLLKLHKSLVSYPLTQSQSSDEQRALVEKKKIFFSTTIAETSLTFPSLRYVIDTGLIHMPIYDPVKNMTEVREVKISKSTIIQRQGRLGRTGPGDYYALYQMGSSLNDYPVPQILQTDLTEIEFSLRRSSLKSGLDRFNEYLPDKPSPQNIDAAIKRLQDLDILDRSQKLTNLGIALSKLPDFGSIAMGKAVLAALQQFACGQDMIRLAAILSVVNTTATLRSIPDTFKRIEGDFMALLEVMNAILNEKLVQPPHLFNISEVCERLGLSAITPIIKRALLRYTSFETFFRQSQTYRLAAQNSSSGQWQPIARSLLEGYSDNVFLSMAEIQSRKHRYIRYTVERTSEKDTYAVLDTSSKLIRPLKQQPVSLVLARDIRISSSIRNRSIISFLGDIQAEWVERPVQRRIEFGKDESSLYSEQIEKLPQFSMLANNVQISCLGRELELAGPTSSVLPLEIFIRNNLVKEYRYNLLEGLSDKRLETNVEQLMKSLQIFVPLKWRWQAENQVKMEFSDKKKEGQVSIQCRIETFGKVKKELDSFVGWLKDCVSVVWDEGVAPEHVIDHLTREPSTDIASRIKSIADPKLTDVDLWPKLQGPGATRESRMEVVAWVAVCHFYCKLEGGFIRDWVVSKTAERPAPSIPPSEWLVRTGKIPFINKQVIPSDLDCHLPSDRYFDLEKFLDEMYDFGIETECIRQPWRYILIFDEHYPTGPFTMDLIEPHVAFTFNRIDFDVNNLYIKRNFCDSLGQRVDLSYEPFSIDLKKIIAQINKKQFRLLRPIDTIIDERIKKMESRGWTRTGEEWSYIPPPGDGRLFVLAPIPNESSLYKKMEQELKVIPMIKIESIEQIRNPLVEKAFHGERNLIAKMCEPAKSEEKCLFHGTNSEAAENILKSGFNQSYFSPSGLYGRGAYFADNPAKSDTYATKNISPPYKMLYCLVALGKMYDQHTTDSSFHAPPPEYNSVRGLHNPQMIEYIVYNPNQVLPYLIITYTKYTG